MNNNIIVLGYAGKVKKYYVESFPRLGYRGRLEKKTISGVDASSEIGGPGYRAATRLVQLEKNPIFYTAVGTDRASKQVISNLESQGIDTSYIHKMQKRTCPVFIDISSNEGITQQYCFDDLHSSAHNGTNTNQDITLLRPPLSAIEYALITTANISLTESVFAYCRQKIANTVWLTPRNLYDLGATRLLQFLRSSNFVIITPYRERQICDMLGLISIEQLLDEGILMIVNIIIKQETSQFRIYSKEKLPTYQIAAPEKYNTRNFLEIEENFAVGFITALSEFQNFFEVVQWGAVSACVDTVTPSSAPISIREQLHAVYQRHYG